MLPELQHIIPYIQEDKLNEVSLTLLLELISNPSIINESSNVDQQILVTRVITLLKSNHSITRWKATKLLTVCLLHPVLLLSSNTANAIAALVKILESKCFIANYENPTEKELITLKSATECLGFVIEKIRGKPTLTREVLTPKLAGIISSLIDVISLVPEYSLKVLIQLLVFNTTTFRPFGMKFENGLKRILNDGENLNKLSPELRSLIMKSLAYVSFILSREKQSEAWKDNVNNIVLELKSVISIYEACLELSNDSDYNDKFHQLPKLPENLSSMNFIFNTLSIDINESPIEIFKVSQRIEVLTELLLSYIEINSPTAVSIPFGHLILIGQILTSFNTNFTPVKSDIRDISTRNMIEKSVIQSKLSGIRILNSLINKFQFEMYPHIYKILAILDASIPVKTINGKIKVDETGIYENEGLIINILETATEYLKICERFNDMTILGRLVESSLILKEAREPNVPTDKINTSNTNSNSRNKKQSKSKTVVSLSDLLSHKQLFINQPNISTLLTIRKFFNILITKCELSPGKISQIVRFAILDSICNIELINEGKVTNENKEIIELLESILLFPGKSSSSISVIPMISNLIGSNSRIYTLLVNPRFPLLPKKINDYNAELEKEEIEEEERLEEEALHNGTFQIPEVTEKRPVEEIEQEERENKRQKVDNISEKLTTEGNGFVFNEESESATEALKEMKRELEKEKATGSSLSDKIIESAEVAENNNMVISEVDAEEDEDDDMGSDFEMPVINVDDD